jgi:hypothetical protein
MDPFDLSGWKTDQREFANWSDHETSSTTSEDDTILINIGYYKILQNKKTYKFILEEEDLIS